MKRISFPFPVRLVSQVFKRFRMSRSTAFSGRRVATLGALSALLVGTAAASRMAALAPAVSISGAGLFEKAERTRREKSTHHEAPAIGFDPQTVDLKSQRKQFTVYRNDAGEIVCREATQSEISERETADLANLGLRRINHFELNKSTGAQAPAATNLTIVLRATQQLQQNAAATAAFTRAAQNWENVIMSPVTVYLDVDFGSTNFGQSWPSGVLGATGSPSGSYSYQSVRTNLIAEADGEGNATKQGIFNSLPPTTLPTDLGAAGAVDVSDSIARAIGLLPPTAQPADDAAHIAFNSNFSFDFDPSDGITSSAIDFDAVATHEIGHALGFDSDAGSLPKPTVWDLYRFRTGTTTSSFPTAQRVLTIGGSPDPLQYDFVPGNSELGLSTGGPSGSTTNGGDGWQSSHWKHVTGCTTPIGIMDPAIPNGCRRTITSNDTLALTSFGYNLTNSNPPPPAPPPAAPPANDNFANAQTISGCSGTITGTTFGATNEANEPSHSPTDKSSLSPNHTVWYQWQASSSGTATITTMGSDFDTILAVYTGASVESLTRIASNDDAKTGGVFTSRITWNAVAGTTYQIAVDGWGGDAGSVKLNWTACTEPPPPPNDNFDNRQTISGCSGSLTGSTAGATSETNEPNDYPFDPAAHTPGHTVWFRWSLPTGSPGQLTMTTQGSDFDTILAVYIDPGPSNGSTGLGSLIRIISNDDSSPGTLTSSVTFNANPGTLYVIVVDGWDGDTGNFQLNWSQTNCVTPTPTPTPPACPTQLVVNDTGDADDANRGDGICATAGGVCTLRAALAEAQARPSCGLVNIDLSRVSGTITLNNILGINHDLNIIGPGPDKVTIQRNPAVGTPNFGIFNIGNSSVMIGGVTIANGFVANGLGGGGIHNAGTLSLMNVSVVNNQTSQAGGGGIFNDTGGSLTIVNSTISGNQTVPGTSTSAGPGGGIFGAGLSLTIVNSTISGNKTGNPAASIVAADGGGIEIFAGTATLINCTVANNQTGSTGGGGGIRANPAYSPIVNLQNTLVANNTGAPANSSPDLLGSFVSHDYNLVGNSSGATFTGTITHNVTNVNPLLGPLTNNGGPTMTHALLAGSPAINAGNNAFAVDQNGIPSTTDQRGLGFPRIFNGTVDIGAYEAGNPIDEASFFVKQQYLDFLNRQPDQSGWDFWTSSITSCGGDAQCIQVKRINASGAFFLSIEFQLTGNLVYRMYKAGFGNLPGKPVAVDRAPFMADTRQIQSIPVQVIVGQGDWQTQLETNRQAFALAFVQRSAFQTAHAGQTAGVYVSDLFTKTEATPTAAETTAAVNAFNNAGGGDAGRAAALRSVAESSSVDAKLKNEAFVLMQYFGYLQRNPYDPPEPTLDYQGYNFWLNKLNQFNGDYLAAEMVKAFISSDEYRRRFGP